MCTLSPFPVTFSLSPFQDGFGQYGTRPTGMNGQKAFSGVACSATGRQDGCDTEAEQPGWLRHITGTRPTGMNGQKAFSGVACSATGPPRWLRYGSRATRMAAVQYGDSAYRNERSERFFRGCLLSDGPPRWRRYGSRATRIKQPPFCNFG